MPAGGARAGAGRKQSQIAALNRQIASLAREYGQEALDIIMKIARTSKNEEVRMTAAIAILDRGYGKPAQSVELNGVGGEKLNFTHIEQIIVHVDRDDERARQIEAVAIPDSERIPAAA